MTRVSQRDSKSSICQMTSYTRHGAKLCWFDFRHISVHNYCLTQSSYAKHRRVKAPAVSMALTMKRWRRIKESQKTSGDFIITNSSRAFYPIFYVTQVRFVHEFYIINRHVHFHPLSARLYTSDRVVCPQRLIIESQHDKWRRRDVTTTTKTNADRSISVNLVCWWHLLSQWAVITINGLWRNNRHAEARVVCRDKDIHFQ